MSMTSFKRAPSSVNRSRMGRWHSMLQRRDKTGTMLDEVLPAFQFRGQVSVVVRAKPQQIFRALKEVALADMPLAYALGTLRYLPGRLTGRPLNSTSSREPFIGGLIAGGTVVMAEQRDREIVLASVGKYHQILDQQPVPLKAPQDFIRFNEPDYQKLAISVRIEGGGHRGEYVLTMEHRTCALSPSSQRKFSLYWVIIKYMGNFVGRLLLRAVKRRAEHNR
jgi:hypothetical protein